MCFPVLKPALWRVANVFMEEIVSESTHGIDLHTSSGHRTNLPQIRADLDDPETERLAMQSGVPALLNVSVRDGSLRGSVSALGIPTLLESFQQDHIDDE